MTDPNNRVFDLMTTAVDKTEVDFSFIQEMREKREIESILDAEFEKREYGEKSAWFPTGKFAGMKIPRGVGGTVDALVVLAMGNVQNMLKSQVSEETVTLYRGVDKWYRGKMVKEGKFIGGGKFHKDYLLKERGIKPGKHQEGWTVRNPEGIFTTTDKEYARINFNKPRPYVDNELVLEFKVPKSYIQNFGRKGYVEESIIFDKGLPKGFLTDIHK